MARWTSWKRRSSKDAKTKTLRFKRNTDPLLQVAHQEFSQRTPKRDDLQPTGTLCGAEICNVETLNISWVNQINKISEWPPTESQNNLPDRYHEISMSMLQYQVQTPRDHVHRFTTHPRHREKAANGRWIGSKLFQIDIFGTSNDGQNMEQAKERHGKSELSSVFSLTSGACD